MRHRLGIDIGGTNTDAAILDEGNRILAKGKTAVTKDIITGITHVISQVLADAQLHPPDITHAMLGTTQVTNAIIERKGFSRVGILRLRDAPAHGRTADERWVLGRPPRVAKPAVLVAGFVGYDALDVHGRLAGRMDTTPRRVRACAKPSAQSPEM